MSRFDRQFSAAARQYDNAAPEDDTRAALAALSEPQA